MTEKRFKMADGNYPQIVVFDGDKGLSYFDMIDLLNAQHEEIQSLKDQLRNLRRLANEMYMEGSE